MLSSLILKTGMLPKASIEASLHSRPGVFELLRGPNAALPFCNAKSPMPETSVETLLEGRRHPFALAIQILEVFFCQFAFQGSRMSLSFGFVPVAESGLFLDLYVVYHLAESC